MAFVVIWRLLLMLMMMLLRLSLREDNYMCCDICDVCQADRVLGLPRVIMFWVGVSGA